jgi:hypothetical protein
MFATAAMTPIIDVLSSSNPPGDVHWRAWADGSNISVGRSIQESKTPYLIDFTRITYIYKHSAGIDLFTMLQWLRVTSNDGNYRVCPSHWYVPLRRCYRELSLYFQILSNFS